MAGLVALGHCHFLGEPPIGGAGSWPKARSWGSPVTMGVSSEPAVVHLFHQAEALAARRHEALVGLHLLAALGAVPSAVRDVLDECHAGFRRVLDCWERQPNPGSGENLQLLRRRVRDVARAFGSRNPEAPHLLLALLDDTNGSARHVLKELGVDVLVLRSKALQIGQGLPTRMRIELPSRLATSLPTPPRAAQSLAAVRGQVVPVMPEHPVVPPRVAQRNPGGIVPSTEGSSRVRGGQAMPVVPDVGPTPLPQSRVRRPHVQRVSAPCGPQPNPRPELLRDEVFEQAADGGAGDGFEQRPSYELPPKKFPILTQIGRNLTLSAALGQADPVVGRDEEVEQALDVLAKRHGNNPCLIGAAGVGKTSVARGIAQALLATLGDERLVFEIPISELVAGTGVRGALAGRLAALKKEVKAAGPRVILFFDEIHQLFAGDAAEEIAADLKMTLARGELPCIGATSQSEYQRVIDADPALARRFTPVEIDEPSREDAFLILSSLAPRLEQHHRVSYDEEALALSISWSLRFLPGRCLPDKAVSVLDLAGARTQRRGNAVVDAEAVAQVVASQANMPVERLLESDGERMLQLEDILCARVVGHEAHLQRIARILRRNAAGLGGRRPIGTFLLLGPTGVGKTETAKAIAEVLFHHESAMTRIDMAEMSEAHAVAKLVGAPPGYVGHDAGGQLTEAVRRRPYQVLLLDEIEKAHPDVLTAFLAVFDEGRMTDSRGRLVDFTNTVIVLTSNLGSRELTELGRKRVGFSSGEHSADAPNEILVAAARKALPPELYNRIDEVLPFSPLARGDVLRIGRKLCDGLSDEVELSRGVRVAICESAIEVLLDSGGYEPELGARPLRRAVARYIEAPLAEALLSGKLKAGDTWHVTGAGGDIRFDITHASSAAE